MPVFIAGTGVSDEEKAKYETSMNDFCIEENENCVIEEKKSFTISVGYATENTWLEETVRSRT